MNQILYRLSLLSTLTLALFVLGFALLPTLHAAEILYVDVDASGSNDGSSWANAYTTLQAALENASPGDELWVAAGIYYPDEGPGQTDDSRLSIFMLTEGVALYGGFAGDEATRSQRDWERHLTILSGDIEQDDPVDSRGLLTDSAQIQGLNVDHVLAGDGLSAAARLDGFFITAGNGNSGACDVRELDLPLSALRTCGGGMVNFNQSSPTLANLVFIGNLANRGGGLSNNNGSHPTLTNVQFLSNTASLGGGLANTYSDPLVRYTHFAHNHASLGGGIYNQYSQATFEHTTVISNTGGNGGGIYNIQNQLLTFEHLLISGNSATTHAGGIFHRESEMRLTNGLVSGNFAAFNVGGIYGITADIELVNVTLSGNRGQSNGGGIFLTNSPITLTNVVIWHNQDGSGYGTANSNLWATFTVPDRHHSLIQGWDGSGTGNIDGTLAANDPDFTQPLTPTMAPSLAGNFRLSATSPAVDSGDGAACPADDLDRLLRPADGDGDLSAVCDMGGYERNGLLPPQDVLALTGSSYTVREDGTPLSGTLAISRSGRLDSRIVVTVSVADGSGTAVADLQQSYPLTLSLGIGEALATIPFTPVDDSLVEPSETFTLTLTGSSEGIILPPALVQITIEDNDLSQPEPYLVYIPLVQRE